MYLSDLLTPALVLDRGRLAANCRAMTGRLGRLGVKLRPHLKTAKSADVAKVALDGNFGGITVSTLKEAEYFLEHGYRDIIYAVGMAPGKLDAVSALTGRGADLKIITDNTTAAQAMADMPLADHGKPLKVLIELDTGDHRGGITPDGPELLNIGKVLHDAPFVTLMGVLTHAGQTYAGGGKVALAAMAESERAGGVLAAERLRMAGMGAPVVSVGSTPGAVFARDLTGVTEARPGVYVFFDLFQAGIGVCGMDDIALSVLATVIGHRPADNVLIIDAGALALSKDRSTEKLPVDCGFGLVSDAVTAQPLDDLKVAAVSQEHGQVTSARPLPFDNLPIGSRVRILPNHACMTAAAYDAYHVVDGGLEIVGTWPRCNGW